MYSVEDLKTAIRVTKENQEGAIEAAKEYEVVCKRLNSQLKEREMR